LPSDEKNRGWIVPAVLAGACAFAVAWLASQLVPSSAFFARYEVWFEGDLHRVYDNLVDRQSNHYRSKVHPLFSIVGYVMVWVPRRLLSIDPVVSVRIIGALMAFVWGALLFALLRAITRSNAASFLFTLAGVASASFLFWASVPETYIFGSISILAAMLVAALSLRSEWLTTGVIAATLSFTITNAMAGLATAITTLPWRRAVQAAANALCIVVILWGVQKFIIPSTQFFLGDKEEKDYLYRVDGKRAAEVTRSFAITSMVMPVVVKQKVYYQPELVMFTQPSRIGRGGALEWSAAVIWCALLLLGVGGLWQASELRVLRIALLLTIAGQLALHLVYGEETFLYSLHFAPLLLVLAAFGARTRARPVVFALVVALIVTAGITNWQRFTEACQYLAKPAPQNLTSRAGSIRTASEIHRQYPGT